MTHNTELIEIKNNTKAHAKLERADKISRSVSVGMVGIGVVVLADAIFDFSAESPALASGYFGSVCLLGGAAIYAINHRFNSRNVDETNQN